jgi:hypothetical protein
MTQAKGFAFPAIVIDWDAINAQQFNNSRAALMAKLDHFMDGNKFGSVTSNVFTRDEMYVLHELLKSATPIGDGETGSGIEK